MKKVDFWRLKKLALEMKKPSSGDEETAFPL
jgi:hypothetical protein